MISLLPEVEPEDQIDVAFFNSLIAAINELITDKGSLLTQYGSVDVYGTELSPSGDYNTCQKSVTFPEEYGYNSATNRPYCVVIPIAHTADGLLTAASPTNVAKDGFTLNIQTTKAYATTYVRVSWIAIGQRA